MALKLHIDVKSKKHNLRALSATYKKDLKNLLRKLGNEGIENIRHEIKKRDLRETEDLVNVEILPNGLKFTIDYEKATGQAKETKVPELDKTLLETVPPETLNKMLDVSSEKGIRQGVQRGIEKTKEQLIEQVKKLNYKIVENA